MSRHLEHVVLSLSLHEEIKGDAAAAGDGLLYLLAVPYADHPDWREEWRP